MVSNFRISMPGVPLRVPALATAEIPPMPEQVLQQRIVQWTERGAKGGWKDEGVLGLWELLVVN